MVKVTVGNTTDRETVIVGNDATLRQVFEDNNISYTRSNVTLNGVTVLASELDKSFAEFEDREHYYLLAVIKADNA